MPWGHRSWGTPLPGHLSHLLFLSHVLHQKVVVGSSALRGSRRGRVGRSGQGSSGDTPL